MFVILQKYDFSSKSQLSPCKLITVYRCLWYCKSTISQANHNAITIILRIRKMFVILQKYDFSSKSQHPVQFQCLHQGCLWYCKSTIFQANHNAWTACLSGHRVVRDTAKVRFFKQITSGYRCRLMGNGGAHDLLHLLWGVGDVSAICLALIIFSC